MSINHKVISDIYDGYKTAKEGWKNITRNSIDANLELMYDLYATLDEYPIIDSKATTEEKKEETQNRFVDLGIFMIDVGGIPVLTKENNNTYSFLEVEDNPLILTEDECEKTYMINSEESLIETKARTIDCENKIAKMCMAQIVRIIEPDAARTANDEDEMKKASIDRIQEYTILLDRIQATRLQEYPKLQNKTELFTPEGYFNMTRFLKKANETNVNGTQEELETEYKEVFNEVIRGDFSKQRRKSIKDIKYDISNFGRFAIAKRLMTKLYTYKESDIYDLFIEYDLIKGTKEQDNVLITGNDVRRSKIGKSLKPRGGRISKAINVAIKGYNQPFSVHLREDLYEILTKKFGKIPTNILDHGETRSLVTSKLKEPVDDIVDIIEGQYNNPEVSEREQEIINAKREGFCNYLRNLQDIKKCRKDIKIVEKNSKIVQEKKKHQVDVEKEAQAQREIAKYRKQVQKYVRKITKLEKKKKEVHLNVEKFNRKDLIMEQIKKANKMCTQLQDLYKQKADLERCLRELQNQKEKTKDD